MKAIDGRGTYPDIEKLSIDVMDHAETIYNMQKETILAPALALGPQTFTGSF